LRRLIAALAVGIAVLAAVLVVRTARLRSRQLPAVPAAPMAIDAAAAAERLGGALRFRTVSYQDPAEFDGAQFRGLHDYLAQRFPRVHQALRRETINDYSLLYTWPGTGDGKPVLLLAHLDVVPVDPSTEASWVQPPFSGAIADGYVWGRGAVDDKGSVLAILEAIEHLLAASYQPPRTVLLAFGHDEELLGEHGAQVIAATLAARGVSPEFVLDEGGSVLEGLLPGVASPVASVGMAEKGYVSIELTVDGTGGHSSIPPRRTVVGQLSAAIDRLEEHRLPANLDAAMRRSFEYIGPEMALPMRLVFANLWLFRPLVEWQMSQSPRTDAILRTTTAPTMFHAGVKENQLPTVARAVVNFRILPGDTVDTVVAHVRRTIDDPQITVAVLGKADEPSPVSDVASPAFAYLNRTIRAVNPDAVVAPFLVLGATDARFYTGLTANVYRFLPMRTRPDDVPRFHGLNERIAVDNYAGMIRFYAELLRGLPQLDGGAG
jgi:carboxypeptidase PM20D1